MCKEPNKLADGTLAACRNCELCRYNRVKDWAGRNIAQAKVSTKSFACTLTYGPELDENRMPIVDRKDHIRAAVLTYSDVQKFFKYLRTHLGFKFRYFVTGEFGGKKGRAHWHVILHFIGKVPSHELGVNFSDRHPNEKDQLFDHKVCAAWPHGFMFWKPAAFEDVFYNCKYILKDEDDEASQRKPVPSKKPPLGAEYFAQWAQLHVDQHIAPQSLEYWFPEIKKEDGLPLKFLLQGRTAEIFLEEYIARWAATHGEKPRPTSNLVDLFEKYGRVVKDEARFLLRQEFPQGESQTPFPDADAIKSAAEGAKKELAERRRQIEEDRREKWNNDWVKSASDEQEQQRRQKVVEWEQLVGQLEFRHEGEQFAKYKQEHGFQFVVGAGWVKSSGSTGPGEGGSLDFRAWRLQRERLGEHERQERVEREPVGPVGKYNRYYGAGRGEGYEPRAQIGSKAGAKGKG